MKVNRGETFLIIGRNANATWWQIHINTLDGWVNARFVTVEHAADVPIVTTPTLTTSHHPAVPLARLCPRSAR